MENGFNVLHKELDLIQALIKKYDDRATLIRGWNISIIALILGISQTSIFAHSTPNNVISLLLLLVVNAQFYVIGINNSQKKYKAIKLYSWVIRHRNPSTDPKDWLHLYNLDISRFDLTDFKLSDLSKKVYGLTWGFIISLMIWNIVITYDKKSEVKSNTTKESKIDSIKHK